MSQEFGESLTPLRILHIMLSGPSAPLDVETVLKFHG